MQGRRPNIKKERENTNPFHTENTPCQNQFKLHKEQGNSQDVEKQKSAEIVSNKTEDNSTETKSNQRNTKEINMQKSKKLSK